MAENEFNALFLDQFLDDYFAEADEHLLSVRRHLLTFEDSLNEGSGIPATVLNELFRSFHTLKGISAMANVTAAETLAHYMESYLRLLRDGHAEFSHEGLEGLVDSTRKLEQIVAARRNELDTPEIGTEVDKLELLTTAAAVHPGESRLRLDAASKSLAPSGTLYKFIFEPSTELASRDINVNSVRAKLESIGAVNDSRPVIKEGGKIAFEFKVSAISDIGDAADWLVDGITVETMEKDPADPSRPAADMSMESASVGFLGQSNVVRVDLARLDQLMLMVGELVISRAKLAEQVKLAKQYLPSDRDRALHEINQTIEKQLRDLRDGVMRVRMVPIGEVFQRMRFVARDLARDSDKRIKLDILGENTEIDKLLVERMLDPLLHLVRNAISHGIENARDREAAGKPVEGIVSLHAATVGETVVIVIADDGRGIDRKAVETKGRERGLVSPDSEFDDEAFLKVLCSPGFSTRAEADKTSGRGVGMDVVKRITDELGGEIEIETRSGEGTSFTIRLPLTLAIANALIVSVGQERFAVPQSNVREVIAVDPGSVTKFENNEVIEYRGEAMSLVRLSRRFDLNESTDGTFHACVVEQGGHSVGLAVDKVVGQSEIVIRSINDPLLKVPGVSGATELGDGRAVLILNVAEIITG